MNDADDPTFRCFLDAARTADAIRSRSGRGALRDHFAEDASLHGLLANLSDLGLTITLVMSSGRERTGIVDLVSLSGVALHSPAFGRSILRLDRIATIRTSTPCLVSGDGQVHTRRSWPTLVASFVDADDDVTIICGDRVITGTIISCSRTLLILESPNRNWHYAVVDEIEEVSVSVPGSIRHDCTNESTSNRFNRITLPNR